MGFVAILDTRFWILDVYQSRSLGIFDDPASRIGLFKTAILRQTLL
jgi:hypothetical protein